MSGSKISIALLDADSNPVLIGNVTNSVRLRLVNQTGADIILHASNPAAEPTLGQFQIQLTLDAFFTNAADSGLVRISGENWVASYLADDEYPCWSIAPTREMTWEANSYIWLTLSNFRPDVQLGSYYLGVDLWNLPEGQSPMPYQVMVAVQSAAPASAKNLHDFMVAMLGKNTDTVYITKIPEEPERNDLVLTLACNGNLPLVPDDVSWGSAPPTFILSFGYGVSPGIFDLCTQAQANSIEVGLQEGFGWKEPKKIDGPQWIIEPSSNNHHVLGPLGGRIVSFSIKNIITQFVEGPTLAYLQCLNVPGYADTCYTLIINKRYRPLVLKDLSITPQSVEVKGAVSAKAYLSWSVSGATLVELSGVGPVPSSQSAFEVPVDRTTPFVLTAYDMFTQSIETAEKIVNVTPDYTTRWLLPGTVLAWNGAADSVPAGYALCDGSNGTPDLRDRFIMGAGKDHPPMLTHGNEHIHPLPAWEGSHPFETARAPAHSHGMPEGWYGRSMAEGDRASVDTKRPYSSNMQSSLELESHSHTVSLDMNHPMTGVGIGGTRPDRYALSYIMLLPAAPT